MADQLMGQTPARASLGGFAGRIALALLLVVGVIVAVSFVGYLVSGLREHVGLVAFAAVGVVAVLVMVSRIVSRRPL